MELVNNSLPSLVSWRGMKDAGALMVRLYGHFGPKLALSVLVMLPSDWLRASWARCNLRMKVSLFRSEFLRSEVLNKSFFKSVKQSKKKTSEFRPL